MAQWSDGRLSTYLKHERQSAESDGAVHETNLALPPALVVAACFAGEEITILKITRLPEVSLLLMPISSTK